MATTPATTASYANGVAEFIGAAMNLANTEAAVNEARLLADPAAIPFDNIQITADGENGQFVISATIPGEFTVNAATGNLTFTATDYLDV